MNRYRYHLDTTSRKYRCPACGRRTFVCYVDDHGRILDPTVGRCDRRDHCRHHLPPREFFSSGLSPLRRAPLHRAPAIIPADFIPPAIVAASMSRGHTDALSRFLHSRMDQLIGAGGVDATLDFYGVGMAALFGGSPVFWQTDGGGHVRTGKIMGYNPTDGRRVKHPRPLFEWAHRLVPPPRPGGSPFNLRQCFFGAHLAAANPRHTLLLLESEKAALIMSMFLTWGGADGTFLPIAVGGCEGLGSAPPDAADPYGKLRCLRHRRVVLFPDRGKFDLWKARAANLSRWCASVMTASVMERRAASMPCPVEPGDGFDDIILRCMDSGADPTGLFINAV